MVRNSAKPVIHSKPSRKTAGKNRLFPKVQAKRPNQICTRKIRNQYRPRRCHSVQALPGTKTKRRYRI